jgi:hypothetical protein
MGGLNAYSLGLERPLLDQVAPFDESALSARFGHLISTSRLREARSRR